MKPFATYHSPFARLLNDHQRLAEFDRLAVFDQDLYHGAGTGRGDLIHGLHCFYDDERISSLHLAPDVDKGSCSRRRASISGANHWRKDNARMLAWVGGTDTTAQFQTTMQSETKAYLASNG